MPPAEPSRSCSRTFWNGLQERLSGRADKSLAGTRRRAVHFPGRKRGMFLFKGF